MEIWKEVKGWEGLYEVSSLGRVKSLDKVIIDKRGVKRNIKGIIKSQCVNKKRGGYKYVTLESKTDKKIKTKSVHRLVAEAFLFNETNSNLIVDHIDSNRVNNRLDNLQLVTYRQNTHKANFKGKTSSHMGVCWHKRHKKWMASIYHNKKIIYLGYYTKEIEAKEAYVKKLKEITNG